jgi:hypothetical protein
MDDIRMVFAFEIAELMEAMILPQRCPDCRAYLLIKKDQEVGFCWWCGTDRENARRAREMIFKMNAKMQGIEFEPQRPVAPAKVEEEETPISPLTYGAPL